MRTQMGVFPIGVNSQDILDAMETQDFRDHLDAFTKQFEDKAVVLSVERLDYSKGIPQKLRAIQLFLENSRQLLKDEVFQIIPKSPKFVYNIL